MIDFALKLMELTLNMTDFIHKLIDPVLKMMDCKGEMGHTEGRRGVR